MPTDNNKPQKPPSSLRAMDIASLADLLAKSGSRKANLATIRQFLDEGAPTNEDGTVDLVKFTAFLEGRRNGKL